MLNKVSTETHYFRHVSVVKGPYTKLGVVEVTAEYQKHIHMDVWLVFKEEKWERYEKCAQMDCSSCLAIETPKTCPFWVCFWYFNGRNREGQCQTWKICSIGHIFCVQTKTAIRTQKTHPIWACPLCSKKGMWMGGVS